MYARHPTDHIAPAKTENRWLANNGKALKGGIRLNSSFNVECR